MRVFASRRRLWATLAVGSTACLVSTGCSATAGPAGREHIVAICATGPTEQVADAGQPSAEAKPNSAV